MLGAESRQGWERCHLRVNAEGELARGRSAGGGDQAMMCAVEPSLEITEDPVHPRPAVKLLSSVMLSLGGYGDSPCIGEVCRFSRRRSREGSWFRHLR